VRSARCTNLGIGGGTNEIMTEIVAKLLIA
jgi:hypothetical protein